MLEQRNEAADLVFDVQIAKHMPLDRGTHHSHRLSKPDFGLGREPLQGKVCADLDDAVDVLAVDFPQRVAQFRFLRMIDMDWAVVPPLMRFML